jgi:hypothetical protein
LLWESVCAFILRAPDFPVLVICASK